MSKVSIPFFRTPYNYDVMAASDESGLSCPEPSLTKQEFTESCDPNFILDRFSKGMDIEFNTREPRYGDFTNMPTSYHEALNFIKQAEQAFMELPAQLRARFDNDAGKFLAFVQDENTTRDQLVDLGLADAVQALPIDLPTSPQGDEPEAPIKGPKGPKKVSAKADTTSPSE